MQISRRHKAHRTCAHVRTHRKREKDGEIEMMMMMMKKNKKQKTKRREKTKTRRPDEYDVMMTISPYTYMHIRTPLEEEKRRRREDQMNMT